MKKYFSCLLLLIPLFGFSQTNVSGGIFSNTTWTLVNSPYIVTGNVTVFQNVVLTIQPGVVIKFQNTFNLTIRGTLNALGTATDSIVFTSNSLSPTPGIWDKINIETVNGAKAYFRYCLIEYAYHGTDVATGGGPGPVTFAHCRFSHNQIGTYGYLSGNVPTPFDTCYFSDNFGAVQTNNAHIKFCTFVNNQNGVYGNTGVSIYKSSFCGHTDKAIDAGGTINYCLIYNNNIGIYPYFSDPIVTNSYIINNVKGIVIGGPGSSYWTNNVICNSQYNIELGTTQPVNVANNCFCGTDSTTIASSIYDGYDNVNYGLVTFIPVTNCDSSALPLVVNCSIPVITNIPVIKNSNAISIFPNPSHGIFTIASINEISRISVYNILGMQVYDSEFKSQKKEIDLSMIESGIYFMKITTPEGIFTKKIIKE